MHKQRLPSNRDVQGYAMTREDMLPDWAYLGTELDAWARLVVNPSRSDTTAKHICWYMLYKDGQYTGKAMLLAVESVVDGLEAVNRLLEGTGLTAQIGEYGDESVLNGMKVEMLYTLLDKHRYVGSLMFTGCDKIYTYTDWMANLL